MKIDITELMNHRTYRTEFDYRFDLDKTDVECVGIPEDIHICENGIHVKGNVVDNLGIMTFSADVCAEYETVCARCLDELHRCVNFSFERTVVPGSGHGKAGEKSHINDDGEWDGITDDLLFANDSRIIPDADIVEELSLRLPMFALCSDDCPGLCPKCGKSLKDGPCGCETEDYINPQLAILRKLLENE